jgi:hypothetical protein
MKVQASEQPPQAASGAQWSDDADPRQVQMGAEDAWKRPQAADSDIASSWIPQLELRQAL